MSNHKADISTSLSAVSSLPATADELRQIIEEKVAPATTLVLRAYQDDAVGNLRRSYATGHKAPLLVLATGGGKTVIFVAVTLGAIGKRKRVLVLVHRRELLKQAVRKLAEAGVPCGVIAAGWPADPDQIVQVASIQTITRRMQKQTLPEFALIVLDEAHHAVAGLWRKFLGTQPKAKILGVTATAARADGKGLGVAAGGIFDDLIGGPEVAELVDGGFLAPTAVFVPAGRIDLRGVRTRSGDYDIGDLERAVDAANLTGNCIGEYRKRADHKPAICFCVSVKHAETVAAAFCAAGYRGQVVSGKTPAKLRDAAIAGLATGEVEVLCSCDLISEGLDVPSVGCIISLRPTKSLVLHRQQLGRGMRPEPGKTLVVLDHAGNCLTHGLPETVVPWSLGGIKKRKPKPAPTWQCPDCECLNPARSLVCAGCGLVREVETPERPDVGRDHGEMALLDRATLEALRGIRQTEFCSVPRTEAELIAYAAAHQYKRGWVQHRLRAQPQMPSWLDEVPPL